MCTIWSSASYLRYIINQQTRPLLTIAHRRPVAAREFCRRYCRTFSVESPARNIRLNQCFGRQTRVLYNSPCLQHLVSAQFMSSQQKSSITDDILKSKLDETMKAAGSGPNQKESKTSADKSSSWFGAKNAWKLGLLSLSGIGILMCGNLLIMWGKFKKFTFSQWFQF